MLVMACLCAVGTTQPFVSLQEAIKSQVLVIETYL